MLLFLLAACSPRGDLLGEVLVSDLHGNHWAMASGRAPTAAFTFSTLEPDKCLAEETGTYCLLFQSLYRTALDGRPEVLSTWSPLDNRDGSDNEPGDLDGRYASVDAETYDLRWQFEYLDFSQLPDGEQFCAYDPADPCHPLPEDDIFAAQHCRLHMPHDMVVMGETEEEIDLWLADTNNERLLRVTAPRDGDCAVVKEVIDDHHPDFDVYDAVNSMQAWTDDEGVETLLFTTKGTLESVGLEQLAGKGKGKVMLWKKHDGTWEQTWEWPPYSEAEESFVNTPHGVVRSVRPDGSEWILFAQSLSLSREWNVGAGGTITVLEIRDGLPVYLFDVGLEGQAAMNFPRDVTPLPDGRFLVTDTGCLGDICDTPTGVWIVSFEDFEAGGTDGVWTPDGSRMTLHTVAADARVDPVGTTRAYSAEWVER